MWREWRVPPSASPCSAPSTLLQVAALPGCKRPWRLEEPSSSQVPPLRGQPCALRGDGLFLRRLSFGLQLLLGPGARRLGFRRGGAVDVLHGLRRRLTGVLCLGELLAELSQGLPRRRLGTLLAVELLAQLLCRTFHGLSRR